VHPLFQWFTKQNCAPVNLTFRTMFRRTSANAEILLETR